jgi:azurin
MSDLSKLYYDASNRLLERSATIRSIPNKHTGTAPMFRRHHRAVLDIIEDIEAIIAPAQIAIGDSTYLKPIEDVAVALARFKALALQQIAAQAPEVAENGASL